MVIHYSWRPMSPDPGDEHVIDCAMNAGATVVTWNVRDFKAARDAAWNEDVYSELVTPLINAKRYQDALNFTRSIETYLAEELGTYSILGQPHTNLKEYAQILKSGK